MKTRNTHTLGILAFVTASLGIGTSSLLAGGGTKVPSGPSAPTVTHASAGGVKSGPYYGLEGGVNLADPLKLSQPLPGSTSSQISLQTGFRVSGRFGYAYMITDKASLGLELEVGFIYNSLKTATNVSNTGTVTSGTASGDYLQVPIMVNAIFNWEFAPKWVVFAGGGAGYDALFLSSSARRNVIGTDGQFAWQIIGGLTYRLSSNWDLSAAYKYLSVQPEGLKTQANHGILVDFIYRF